MQIKLQKNYLNYKNGVLYYKDINCLDLVTKFGNPLKVGYVDIIREKITSLKAYFEKAISKYSYQGKYIFANANKASYYSENVITAGTYADMYETSSYIDLKIVERIIKNKIVDNKKIICNGIKDKLYVDQIIKMINKGYDILFVIDNESELNILLDTKFNRKVEIGFRLNLPNLYAKSNDLGFDRFGLKEKELIDCLKKYKKNENLVLTTLHFHQRGSLYNQEKCFENIEKAYQLYSKIVKDEPNLVNFDFGGGTPYDKINEFDYEKYADDIIKLLKGLGKKYNISDPNIIQENGRYTVSDSCFNIYKVETVKNSHDDKPWYVINGSIMTSLVNTWALKERFLFLPINLANNKLIKVRIAGDTCDGDDVYFYQNSEKYCIMPEIKKGETLYIGVFGCGAYQEILSGIGGIHHCLNPEENDLIIYKKNGKNVFYKIRGSQNEKAIFKRLNYLKVKEMKRFKIKKQTNF